MLKFLALKPNFLTCKIKKGSTYVILNQECGQMNVDVVYKKYYCFQYYCMLVYIWMYMYTFVYNLSNSTEVLFSGKVSP